LDINEIDDSLSRLALTLLAYGNSRFCLLKFAKPVHERHLQASNASASLNFLQLDKFFFSILLLLLTVSILNVYNGTQ
jgi:hypothetical protein